MWAQQLGRQHAVAPRRPATRVGLPCGTNLLPPTSTAGFLGRTHATGPSTSPPVAGNVPNTAVADLEAAWETLRDFTLKEFRGVAQEPYLSSPAKREKLRAALLLAYRQPYPAAGWTGPGPDNEVLLGVVASDVKFAARAYRDWCDELGLELVRPASRVEGMEDALQLKGGVYLKYNSKTKLCYVTRYDGKDRGVLVQLGQLQLGHFPLGFFDETLSKPAPSF